MDATPIGDALKDRLGLEARIESDVNLAALAQHWFGRGREVEDFIVVALTQTVGLAILHKGELYRGGAGTSADLGWYLLETDGNRPHLESCDDGAVIGRAIANVASLLAPSMVVLAGEGVRDGSPVLEPLQTAFHRALSPALDGRTRIVVDEWDDDAWARGAAALVLRDLYGAPWSTTGPRIPRAEGGARTDQGARTDGDKA